MLYRVLIGVGLVALGYYIGRQVGRVEGQMGQDVGPIQGDPLGDSRPADSNDS